MEDLIYKNLITMVGIMFAAIVGGFFSFVSLISSKEQKVSEFRQEWINSLRESVSQYISALYYLSTLYKHYVEQNPEKKNRFEMTKGVEETYSKVNKAYNDIIFRINENEKREKAKILNDEFLASLEKTRDQFNKNEFSEVKNSCNELRNHTKPLLKLEWVRVKNGETTYRYSKYFAVAVLSLGFVVFASSAYIIFNSGIVGNNNIEIKEQAVAKLPDNSLINEKPNNKINKDSPLNTPKPRIE